MKIALKKRKEVHNDLRVSPVEILSALPFIENTRAYLIHRPMNALQFRHFQEPHLSVQCYCGTVFTGKKNLTFLSKPPKNSVVCQRCESIAVSDGLPASSDIAGFHVHTGGLKVVLACGCKNDFDVQDEQKEQP